MTFSFLPDSVRGGGGLDDVVRTWGLGELGAQCMADPLAQPDVEAVPAAQFEEEHQFVSACLCVFHAHDQGVGVSSSSSSTV